MTAISAQQSGAPLFDNAARVYDALLVLSFGGPEGMDDVMPFLENVTRGRNIPRERLEEVAEHYAHFGGISPINAQNRALIASLERELADHGIDLPIYFGNRNWHPLLPDNIDVMRTDGVKNALLFVTSAYSSYSGCRQYRENIAAAQEQVGPGAPQVDKLRAFFNHPYSVGWVIDPLRGDEALFLGADCLPVVVRDQRGDGSVRVEELVRGSEARVPGEVCVHGPASEQRPPCGRARLTQATQPVTGGATAPAHTQ